MERPLDKHRLCLVRTGRKVRLEFWRKTRRRKSPWDRFLVGSTDGEKDGITLGSMPDECVARYEGRIRELLPEFDPLAMVEAVSLR